MNREELIVEALASDVHEEDGWLSDAQTAHLEWDADNRAVRFQGEGRIDLAHLAEIVSSVFEQAHTMSDDEREALARDIHAAHARRWCIRDEGETCPEARQIADALLARRTVQGEPTTMRQEAEKWAAVTPIGPESAPIQAFEAGWRSAMSRTVQGEPSTCQGCSEDDGQGEACRACGRPYTVQGEPTDAQVQAALNAYDPQAATDDDVADWGDDHVADMRAALRAAWAARQEEDR